MTDTELILDLQCAGQHSEHAWLVTLVARAAARLTALREERDEAVMALPQAIRSERARLLPLQNLDQTVIEQDSVIGAAGAA